MSFRATDAECRKIKSMVKRSGLCQREYLLHAALHQPIYVMDELKPVLSEVRFHDLRHTFAALALQNGVDIKTVSGMLGHYSAGFTLDTYTHVTTAAQKDAADKMGHILSGAFQT